MTRFILTSLCLFTLFIVTGCDRDGKKILDIQTFTTPAGFHVWFVKDTSVPVLSTTFLFKGAGAVVLNEETQGLTQILSNMLDEGAGELDSTAFQKALLDDSIQMSFSASRDNFSGNLKTLSEKKERAFELLALALTEPRFDAEPLQRMIDANLSRVRGNLSDTNWIAARITNDKAFEGHPYRLNSGGTLSSLPEITAEDLQDFTTDYLTQDRLIIGVAGDATQKELSALIDKTFSKLPKAGVSPEIANIKLQNLGQAFHYPLDVPQSVVTMVLPGITRDNPDYYAFQVMNQIFGAGGFGARLTKSIREEQGLAYGIFSTLSRMEYAQILFITSSTKNESVGQLVESVKKEMGKIATNLVSADEMNDAKNYIVGSLPLSFTTTDAISGTLVALQEENLPTDYLDTFPDSIQAITLEDIRNIAAKMLMPEQIMTVIVGDAETLDSTVQTVSELENVR